jgi:hypothetical protein
VGRFAGISCRVVALALVAACADGDGALAPTQPEHSAGARSAGGLAAPSNLGAVALSTSRIALTWQDNSSTETGFEVHRSTNGTSGTFTPRSGVAADVGEYTDALLTGATEYCYKVRAARLVKGWITWSAFSNTACATTPSNAPSAPNAPSSARALESSGATILVSWEQVAGEDGFRIERSANGLAGWALATSVGADVTAWTADQIGCYRIIAFNAGGESPPSPVACPVPAAPTGLNVTSNGPDSLVLDWSDNSGIEDTYEVWAAYDVYGFSCASWNGEDHLLAELPADSASLRTSLAALSNNPNGGCAAVGFYVRARSNDLHSEADYWLFS